MTRPRPRSPGDQVRSSLTLFVTQGHIPHPPSQIPRGPHERGEGLGGCGNLDRAPVRLRTPRASWPLMNIRIRDIDPRDLAELCGGTASSRDGYAVRAAEGVGPAATRRRACSSRTRIRLVTQCCCYAEIDVGAGRGGRSARAPWRTCRRRDRGSRRLPPPRRRPCTAPRNPQRAARHRHDDAHPRRTPMPGSRSHAPKGSRWASARVARWSISRSPRRHSTVSRLHSQTSTSSPGWARVRMSYSMTGRGFALTCRRTCRWAT